MISFPTKYNEIIGRIEAADARKYEKTRNFINGAVTYLSPFIARGVIQLPQIKQIVVPKFGRYVTEKLIQELAWREFFQRVWQHKGSAIFSDLKQDQENVKHRQIPTKIVSANTGIEAIDKAISQLYQTGYMHNHARMYTAMLTCNIAKSHWHMPAKWMYYHLLDGDLASNMLSWQWVAGSFSSKKYYANQDNINKYAGTQQHGSYLDCGYEAFPFAEIPVDLKPTEDIHLTTPLPEKKTPVIDPSLPTLIYNSYNLDPNWHNEINANRILLLEPDHFEKFPISEKVIHFILNVAKDNILDIQVFTGAFKELETLAGNNKIIFKEHPIANHYKGIQEERAWLFPAVNQYFGSFFSYWKKCERYYQEK